MLACVPLEKHAPSRTYNIVFWENEWMNSAGMHHKWVGGCHNLCPQSIRTFTRSNTLFNSETLSPEVNKTLKVHLCRGFPVAIRKSQIITLKPYHWWILWEINWRLEKNIKKLQGIFTRLHWMGLVILRSKQNPFEFQTNDEFTAEAASEQSNSVTLFFKIHPKKWKKMTSRKLSSFLTLENS